MLVVVGNDEQGPAVAPDLKNVRAWFGSHVYLLLLLPLLTPLIAVSALG